MSSNKKTLLRTVFTSNGSCGCGKTRVPEVHEPSPKGKGAQAQGSSSSMSCSTSEELCEVVPKSKRSPLVDSVAIEKNSSDPYHDFKHSMLQMIFEKEIQTHDDLRDLLQCFLQLNAPCHHHVILKAFNEICQRAFPHTLAHLLLPHSG